MWDKITTIFERVRTRLFGNLSFSKADIARSYVTDEMAAAIDRWAKLYKNKAPWLTNNAHGMGLPSAIAREIATLVTLEMQVTVSDPNTEDAIDDDAAKEEVSTSRAAFVKRVLDDVLDQIQMHTEYACALGGIVFRPYWNGEDISVDIVHADDFYPISFNSRGEVKSAMFLEHKRKDSVFYTRVERHDVTKTAYIITNTAYKSSAESDIGTQVLLTEVEEWAEIQPQLSIDGIDFPLFAYFRIPQGNMINNKSHLGVSVYARADSAGLLEEADKQWQRLLWEYEGGELAIDVSENALRHEKSPDGKKMKFILPAGKDRLFRMNALDENSSNELLKVFSPALRDSSFADGVNSILMRIEDLCGLARGTYSDVNEQVRTATELKISRQRSYATVTAIQRSLEKALDALARAVDALASLYNIAPYGEYSIAYVWDDSIVVDADAEREKDRQDVLDGMLTKWEYRVKWYGETEEQAKAVLAENEPPSDDAIMGFSGRFGA